MNPLDKLTGPRNSVVLRREPVPAESAGTTPNTEIEVKPTTKRCPRCNRSYGRLDRFHRMSASRDGRQGYCKECQSDYQKARAAKGKPAKVVSTPPQKTVEPSSQQKPRNTRSTVKLPTRMIVRLEESFRAEHNIPDQIVLDPGNVIEHYLRVAYELD